MPILFVIAALVAIPLKIYANRQWKARISEAKLLAAKYGFEVDTDTKGPPSQRFDLFGLGHRKKVTVQFWRRGEQDSVFDYEYTTGSGKNRKKHRRTVAMIALPFAAPHTTIGPEGFWSGVGRMVGLRDIEVESPDFNDQYRVTGDDERFAVTLLDQQMLAWLLSSQSGRGAIRFELWGSWLLCVSEPLGVQRMLGYLDWAQGVRMHMPDVLPSLYPIGRAR